MPAVKLPKKLSARLGFLAVRVRKIRTLRAVARAGFVIPAAAFACIMADAYVGFPTAMRYGLFGGWLALVGYLMWTIRRARTAEVDLESIASAVEEQFPRLAERLTTAVELAASADESNGAPALIDEVIRDADSRARKLDLGLAFPTAGVVSAFVASMALLLVLVAPVFFAPRGGELLRRFFAPWYTPSVRVDFKLVVTSGDPAVKRGDPVTLSAYIEATREGARLPASAVAIVTANGKDERVAMTADEPNVWHLKRPAADGDFDYRIEAGGAVSEAHHVTVVEPVTLAAARVTVKPPAYAAQGRDGEAAVEGLGELSALQHSTVTFDLRFHPRPVTAALEFTTNPKEDAKGTTTRTPLAVAADGSVQVTVPAFDGGTFALTAEGQSGVKSEFPPQPLRVHPDEAPKFPQVTGLGD
ncbi:MAG TPA: hypothetical protein VM597_34600, partial [Gemmataceae bacterium]|nr:hypothetical protein [Gemmataceae bacterium]